MNVDKLTKALPEIEEIVKLLPDMDKIGDSIGENYAFLKSLLQSAGEYTAWRIQHRTFIKITFKIGELPHHGLS